MSSDYGTSAMIRRRDGADTTDADEAKLNAAVKEICTPERDRISPYADFEIKFGGLYTMDGKKGLSVSLTDYFLEDDPDAAALAEGDLELAGQFCDELQSRLGDEYEVNVGQH